MDIIEDRFSKIDSKLNEKNGVMTITMGELRNAADASKLGKYVVEKIISELKKRGIGYHHSDSDAENELPGYQNKCMRLYRKGTPIGDIIEAIIEVHDEENAKENNEADELIRTFSANTDSEILNKVRSLVCA